MKNNTIVLLKLIFINQFKLNKLIDKNRKQRIQTILMGGVFLLLAIMLCVYSYFIGYGLGVMGIAWVIPGYAITIVGIITLFFTIFKSNGILFGTKDYEILMSLPVKTSEIIASRLIHMYMMNTFLAFLIMLPLGIVYYLFERPTGSFGIIWLGGMFFSTLFPTTLAAIFGGMIVYIASHFKYTNAFATILSLLLVIGIIASSYSLGGIEESSVQMMELAKLGEMISKQLHSAYPLSSVFEKAVRNHDIVAFLLFIAVSLGIYMLFVKVLSIKYQSINTAILTHSAKSNYKLQEMKASGVTTALYKKELKRFFSSYAYVLNVGIGSIMALMMAVAVFILEPSTIEAALEMSNLESVLIKVIAFTFSTVLCMSCTTGVSLSLEGKNLWILKSLPVSAKKILDSKILVNLTLTLPISFLFGILMNIKFDTDLITKLFFFIIPVIYSFFIAVWGMFINCKLPNYEWESETAVIKQGLSSMIGMLGGPIFALIPTAAIILFSAISYQIIQAVAVLIIIIFTAILYQHITRYEL